MEDGKRSVLPSSSDTVKKPRSKAALMGRGGGATMVLMGQDGYVSRQQGIVHDVRQRSRTLHSGSRASPRTKKAARHHTSAACLVSMGWAQRISCRRIRRMHVKPPCSIAMFLDRSCSFSLSSNRGCVNSGDNLGAPASPLSNVFSTHRISLRVHLAAVIRPSNFQHMQSELEEALLNLGSRVR